MNKQHAEIRIKAKKCTQPNLLSFFFLVFFFVGSSTVMGQSETRSTINSVSVSSTSEKSKLEYQKTENSEVNMMYSKVIALDQDIRNFIDRNQLAASVTDQYLMKITSICSDCVQEKVLESSAVFTHIKNSTNSTLLLDFMEEFLTNLSNQ